MEGYAYFMALADDAELLAQRADGQWPREQFQLIADEWRRLAVLARGIVPPEPRTFAAGED